MRLHMLGLPHTRTVSEQSHCAYTGKIRRFGPMMKAFGYTTIHYGVGYPDNSEGWSDCVEIMTPEQQRALLGYDPLDTGAKFIGNDANVGHVVYRAFNETMRQVLSKRTWSPEEDVLCLPFGHGHQAALINEVLPVAVETGIGYPTCIVPYRIYESYAWLHWHLGRDQRHASPCEWVIPNYFDTIEWPVRTTLPKDGEYVLYFGRICQIKGLNVVWNLALMRHDLRFVVCGQGDPTPWLLPNLEYHPPVHGKQRYQLMHKAKCVLVPTEYVEPFGGVAVEAMLTGTPVITSDHGAFTETVPDARFRPHNLYEWLAAMEAAFETTPDFWATPARAKYSLWAVGAQYDRVFQDLPRMRREGWGKPPQ